MESPKSPQPLRILKNPLVFLGLVLAVISGFGILLLVLGDIFDAGVTPYFGFFAYIILPFVFILGVVFITAGTLIQRWRRRAGGKDESAAMTVPLFYDRMKALGLLVGLMVFLAVVSVLGYRTYQFTETVGFCGQVCHTPMKPEFTAYQASPHARVQCAECHVGPGASWYVRSKVAGTYQLYAVTFNKFPRPIESPVKRLRPARETCEKCHWPEKFWGNRFKIITHFGSDEKNTPRQIQLVIKTGGGSPTSGLTTGIHWHMNIMNEVTYIAMDRQRQEIPWIRVKDMQGRVTEYMSKEKPLTPEQVAKAEKRRMDCIDCHNRPSHVFQPPQQAVDQALMVGRIDRSLPYIKQQAVEVMSKTYPTTEAAREGIASGIDAFYFTKYPSIYEQRRTTIRAAITEIQRLYETNIFPEMKVDWETHPNNLGHFNYPGCFRCHDGQHVSPEGKVITKDCKTCHIVVGQEVGGKPMAAPTGRAFRHPVDIGDIKEATCSLCHSGGPGP